VIHSESVYFRTSFERRHVMGIFQKVHQWRSGWHRPFKADRPAATTDACIGAAEYELHSITRDVAAVLMDKKPAATLRRPPV
jgi:hypothetical protein